MLRSLFIRNFAIVESLDLSLEDGLTVFTGETGAGKTILVEAIRFLLGGKTSVEMVRTGTDLAVVEGDFDGVMLRRELNTQGRSRCFRDDAQIAISELATLGEQLADHCGQHQHQVLLDPARHLDWLDQSAGTVALAADVKANFAALLQTVRAIEDLQAKIARRQSEEELRLFQIGEIRAAAIQADEEERLKVEATVLKHARRLAEAANLALNILSDDESSVERALGRVRREAENSAMVDPRWQEIITPLAGASDSVNDAVRLLTSYRDQLSFDPQRADQIESRLSDIYRLKKKYGDSCVAILERLEELEAEQSSDAALDQALNEEGERRKKLEDTLVVLASDLSIKRHRAAESLTKAVNTVIARLGMSKASIRVELSPHTDGGLVFGECRLHEDGAELVRLLFEANPSEGFKPLHKIASGGELSRLLLAFKSATAKKKQPRLPLPSGERGGKGSLYIFDEIDSGIGGQTAHAVAREIKALASGSQVFLITHLQQLATVADAHFRITKKTKGGRAQVGVDRLEGDDRVRELARMIAGDEVTPRTLDLAAELAAPRKKS